MDGARKKSREFKFPVLKAYNKATFQIQVMSTMKTVYETIAPIPVYRIPGRL
jgi:hypothetical protein